MQLHARTRANVQLPRRTTYGPGTVRCARTVAHGRRSRSAAVRHIRPCAIPQHGSSSLLDEPIEARMPAAPSPELINGDLAPTPADRRTLTAGDIAALWVSLVVSTTTLMLAGSLVDMGMSWVQGVLCVFIGNLITLVPLIMNGFPGTKYGIPFPVLARASFGIKGANIPGLARALVARGWYGINTTIGGNSIFQMLQAITGGALTADPIPWLGLSGPEAGCFAVFWALQLAVITRGIESIKAVEKYSAPVLVALALALMGWAVSTAGGLGPMLSQPSRLTTPQEFARVFVPAITAQVGYWATLAINVSDFTRYAKSQRAQVLGQAVGLPPFMAVFSFVGLAVTSASVLMTGGTPIIDPVELLSRVQQPAAIVVALFGLLLATLTTNIAANVVGPANAFVNLSPSRITFKAGGTITAALAAAICPWRLLSSSSSFIGWLVAYSSLLGSLIGVVIADYWCVRRRVLDVDALYSSAPGGKYFYRNGYNPAAVIAVTAGVLPCLPGMLAALGLTSGPAAPLFAAIYDAAWFVAAAVSSVVYVVLMRHSVAPETEPGAPGVGGTDPLPA